jgi:hypothetical protein
MRLSTFCGLHRDTVGGDLKAKCVYCLYDIQYIHARVLTEDQNDTIKGPNYTAKRHESQAGETNRAASWLTGWGRLSEFGQISPVLREVSLPIISNSQCMKMYR